MANETKLADHLLTTRGPWVDADGYCYFWGVPSRRIKIGSTSNPRLRERTLRYQYNLPCISFLAVMTGGSAVEAAYHARFAEHRIEGEWFHPAPEILAEIARLNSEPHP